MVMHFNNDLEVIIYQIKNIQFFYFIILYVCGSYVQDHNGRSVQKFNNKNENCGFLPLPSSIKCHKCVELRKEQMLKEMDE